MARDELQVLPGIGQSLAADLRLLGVTSVKSLARRDPERMYARLCDITREKQDPCVLYVFRCAVYASRTEVPDRKLLEWPAWMERRFDARGRVVKTTKGVPAKYSRVQRSRQAFPRAADPAAILPRRARRPVETPTRSRLRR